MKLTRITVAAAAVVLLAACTIEEDPTAIATETEDIEPEATDTPVTDPPATEPPATEPPATDPPVTDPPATDPPATDPPVTEPAIEFDEFEVWLMAQLPTVLRISDDAVSISTLLNEGDVTGAARVAERIGEDYTALYLDAPVTSTELSDVTNNMLLICSVAYTASAAALDTLDTAAMEAATGQLGECSALLTDVTALLPG